MNRFPRGFLGSVSPLSSLLFTVRQDLTYSLRTRRAFDVGCMVLVSVKLIQ